MHTVLIEKPKRETSLRRPKRRWEDNITRIKEGERVQIGSIQMRGSGVGCCGDGKEPSSCKNVKNFMVSRATFSVPEISATQTGFHRTSFGVPTEIEE